MHTYMSSKLSEQILESVRYVVFININLNEIMIIISTGEKKNHTHQYVYERIGFYLLNVAVYRVINLSKSSKNEHVECCIVGYLSS